VLCAEWPRALHVALRGSCLGAARPTGRPRAAAAGRHRHSQTPGALNTGDTQRICDIAFYSTSCVCYLLLHHPHHHHHIAIHIAGGGGKGAGVREFGVEPDPS
jgi:hypothetical protein